MNMAAQSIRLLRHSSVRLLRCASVAQLLLASASIGHRNETADGRQEEKPAAIELFAETHTQDSSEWHTRRARSRNVSGPRDRCLHIKEQTSMRTMKCCPKIRMCLEAHAQASPVILIENSLELSALSCQRLVNLLGSTAHSGRDLDVYAQDDNGADEDRRISLMHLWYEQTKGWRKLESCLPGQSRLASLASWS